MSNYTNQTDLFLYDNIKSVNGYNVLSIFKNDKVNGSIFEDGLTNYLGSPTLIAETWGRPLQSAWCNPQY